MIRRRIRVRTEPETSEQDSNKSEVDPGADAEAEAAEHGQEGLKQDELEPASSDHLSVEDSVETGTVDEPGIEAELEDDEFSELELEDASEGSEYEQEDERDREILELRSRLEEAQDKYLRAVAELENSKKRAAKERSELLRYAGEPLARDLLEVVDQLELAVSHESVGSVEEFLQGVNLVLERFRAILRQHQIVDESSLNQSFDPAKHEAMTTVPRDDMAPGLVTDELRKAYFYKDKLLRAAQVVVSREPDRVADDSDTEEEEPIESDADSFEDEVEVNEGVEGNHEEPNEDLD